MTGYGLAVPDGTYRVDLSFAELQFAQAGDTPIINGILVTEVPPGSPGS
jgi:hypothetical protein